MKKGFFRKKKDQFDLDSFKDASSDVSDKLDGALDLVEKGLMSKMQGYNPEVGRNWRKAAKVGGAVVLLTVVNAVPIVGLLIPNIIVYGSWVIGGGYATKKAVDGVRCIDESVAAAEENYEFPTEKKKYF